MTSLLMRHLRELWAVWLRFCLACGALMLGALIVDKTGAPQWVILLPISVTCIAGVVHDSRKAFHEIKEAKRA